MTISSISGVTKNKKVKNKEVKNVHHYDDTYDDRYGNINSDNKYEWTLKQYQVNNDTETLLSQRKEYDPVDSFPASAFVNTVKLEWILKKYCVDNVNYNRYKHNGCQVLLSRSKHQMVQSNDIHFDYVSIFEVPFRLVYQLVKNIVYRMTPIDDNKGLNNNTCYGFYLYGNCPDNIDTRWYYFVNSNNYEIPEDELNYQTSKVDSKDMVSTLAWKVQARILSRDGLNYRRSKIDSDKNTSTMKWKILVRRLGSDMNDEYHKETINIWKTEVVVQVVMHNDHSKQDQHNQKKELKQCDHTDTNKEDQVYYDSNNDDNTFHDANQVEDVF